MEPVPPSPSVFLDLPQTADDDGEQQLSLDDMALPYISRVLMEDDTDDNLLYSDHPGLLEVQKPYAQILFSHSFGTKDDSTATMASSVPLHGIDSANKEVANGDQSKLTSALSKGADAVEAFLKGMEEASRLLPKYSSFRRDGVVDNFFSESSTHRGLKKRSNRDEHLEEEDVGRARKAVTMAMAKEVEVVREIFEDMMLHGIEACVRDMDMEKLRIAKAKETVMNRKRIKKEAAGMVDLRMLLILCAQEVTAGNRVGTDELLKQIKRHASAKGDATQRLSQCFAEGLEARLAGSGSQVYKSLMAKHPSVMEFLNAYKLYIAACCIDKVAYIFNIMTILHAIRGKNRLHIVEFGTNFGLEWSCLFDQLGNREGGPPEVRITSIGCPQLRSFPTERIEEIGCRLSNCARKFGLTFKFHSIMKEWEAVFIADLNTNADEVLVVIDHCNLSTLMDDSIFADNPSPKDTVLRNISKMQPDVFIQNIINCSSGTSFLTRFRAALFYFTALFDMLDATIPRESEPRLVLEQGLFGRCALNVIACEGVDLMDRPEKYKQWQARNKRAGLRQLPLKPNIIQVARDRVMKFHHKDFLLGEDDQWLIHGWMGRVLFAHSTWVAKDAPSSE